MTTIRFDQSGLPAGENNRSRDDIVAGVQVEITNINPGTSNSIELLWKPPEDDTAVISGDPGGVSYITPKAGTFGTYRILLTVDGVEMVKTFSTLSPVLGLQIPAANERANPNASLVQNTSAEIEDSETNQAFPPFATGSAFGWWRSIERLFQKAEALFNPLSGHTHDGTDDNGPPTVHAGLTNNPHSVTAGQAGAAASPHAIGGSDHSASTLAEVNTKITDGVLISKDSANIFTAKQSFADSNPTANASQNLLQYDADPSSPIAGDIILTSGSHPSGAGKIRSYNGSSWDEAGGSGVQLDQPNTWTRIQTFAPTVSETAIEITGFTGTSGDVEGGIPIIAIGGNGFGIDQRGGHGGQFTGGSNSGIAPPGSGIVCEGGNASVEGEGGIGGDFTGGSGAGDEGGGDAVSGYGGQGSGNGTGGTGGRFTGGYSGATGNGGIGVRAQGGAGAFGSTGTFGGPGAFFEGGRGGSGVDVLSVGIQAVGGLSAGTQSYTRRGAGITAGGSNVGIPFVDYDGEGGYFRGSPGSSVIPAGAVGVRGIGGNGESDGNGGDGGQFTGGSDSGTGHAGDGIRATSGSATDSFAVIGLASGYSEPTWGRLLGAAIGVLGAAPIGCGGFSNTPGGNAMFALYEGGAQGATFAPTSLVGGPTVGGNGISVIGGDNSSGQGGRAGYFVGGSTLSASGSPGLAIEAYGGNGYSGGSASGGNAINAYGGKGSDNIEGGLGIQAYGGEPGDGNGIGGTGIAAQGYQGSGTARGGYGGSFAGGQGGSSNGAGGHGIYGRGGSAGGSGIPGAGVVGDSDSNGGYGVIAIGDSAGGSGKRASLKVNAQTALPDGELGAVAVQGSTLYFHDGTSWRSVNVT